MSRSDNAADIIDLSVMYFFKLMQTEIWPYGRDMCHSLYAECKTYII